VFGSIKKLTAAIYWHAKVIGLRKPGRVFLVLKRDDPMLSFVLMLPEPSAVDVVTQELSVQVGGDDPILTSYPAEIRETDEMSGNDNDAVTGSLVLVDDAGNRSEPRDFDFVLTDTVSPPQPGEVGLRVTGEE
jgi:hypothetical protein